MSTALLRRGHRPVVYSPRLGSLAAEIRQQTIPVVDDLTSLAEPPDIIHGHHGPETLTALLAFPGVPAVSVCHSWIGWADAPVRFPRIHRYLAVDDTCRHRLVAEHGVPPDRVEVVLNAVDLQRFRPRPALPPKPLRALIFSNSSGEEAPHVRAIRAACARTGIHVELAGFRSGHLLERPEDALGAYDIVFAKARAAFEAAAVGTAVVLCDVAGAGPMVRTSNLDELRRVNFGRRALRDAPTIEWALGEIARYDAADAAAVSRRVRVVASHEAQVDHLLDIYRDVLAAHRAAPADPDGEQRAAAVYLRRLSHRLYERDLLHNVFARLFRLPLVGGWVRRRAGREQVDHWFRELLRALDTE